MRKRISWWCAVALVGIPLLAGPALGQDVEDRDLWAGGEDVWTNDDGWVDDTGAPSGAPSPVDADRWALVDSGNVIVDGDIGTSGLTLNGGVVQVNDGASLTVDIVEGAFSVGQSSIGRNGTLRLLGSGKYVAGLDVKNSGTVDFQSPTASLEAGGAFASSGALNIAISGAGTSSITVGGDASITGVVSPTFDGVTPAFGDAWPFLIGASSVSIGNKASVALPESVSLPTGLDARLSAGTDSASIIIGNLPVLQVDRVSGAASIKNVVGGDLSFTGYSIGSELGLLNNDAFTGTGVAGFDTPNPLNTTISEISLEGTQTLAVGDSVSIGNAYNGGATHPRDEDVSFEFSTTAGEIIQGLVEYAGPANDLVANANPETGEISIYHLSQHLDAIDLTGYMISSASGSLSPDNLNGFADTGAAGAGWAEANPNANSISETNLEASTSFANGTVIPLGNIFNTSGGRDLTFHYTSATELLEGTITYGEVPGDVGPPPIGGCMPVNELLGDLDGNLSVEFADFLTLSSNFGNTTDKYSDGDIDCDGEVAFADFLTLSANFGQSLPQGAAAAVPEPNSGALFGIGAGLVLAFRRRRQTRSRATEPSSNRHTQLGDVMQKTLLVPLLLFGVCVAGMLISTSKAYAQGTVLGEGTGALIGGDLTDPEDDGDPEADVGYNAVFRSNEEPGFAGGEFSFNVFDNILGPGNDKWCCGAGSGIPEGEGLWVEAELEAPVVLTNFTVSSANDVPNRDPTHWAVLGSNNGVDYETIFEHDGDSLWGDTRFQVIEFSAANGDYKAPSNGHKILRMATFNTASAPAGAYFQIGEIEFFGVPPVAGLPGDFNTDGVVDVADYQVLLDTFSTSVDSFGAGADINFSGKVDLADFLEFRMVFNAPGAAAASVPEPSSILLFGLALGGISTARRRRR